MIGVKLDYSAPADAADLEVSVDLILKPGLYRDSSGVTLHVQAVIGGVVGPVVAQPSIRLFLGFYVHRCRDCAHVVCSREQT